MSITVQSLMAQGVVIATREHTADYVRRQMKTLDIHAVPVADAEGRPIGIVRWRDLLDVDDEAPVAEIASPHVLTADLRTDVRQAARVMRSQGRHHIVITDRGKIAGIVSAFDFLRLVEADAPSEQNPQAETRESFNTGIFQIQRPDDA
ncbi:MAG: CBS domain-containing protein [Acidobacteriota bacterium]